MSNKVRVSDGFGGFFEARIYHTQNGYNYLVYDGNREIRVCTAEGVQNLKKGNTLAVRERACTPINEKAD